jgi:sortase A
MIPSIGVDAPIISLGVDPDGRMQVPNNGTDVGWYDFSTVPGMPGNAVLSGHLDTATSPTAVFRRLNELKQGAEMSVIENGKKIDFDVFWTRSWPDETAPLALILGSAPSPTLTLITCSGTFDRTNRNYTERLVVRSKLPGSV